MRRWVLGMVALWVGPAAALAAPPELWDQYPQLVCNDTAFVTCEAAEKCTPTIGKASWLFDFKAGTVKSLSAGSYSPILYRRHFTGASFYQVVTSGQGEWSFSSPTRELLGTPLIKASNASTFGPSGYIRWVDCRPL